MEVRISSGKTKHRTIFGLSIKNISKNYKISLLQQKLIISLFESSSLSLIPRT